MTARGRSARTFDAIAFSPGPKVLASKVLALRPLAVIQYEPRRGEVSDARTEVLVLYDTGHLYVAFRAWDAEPITAQLTQRDADLFLDDAVAVVLDTTLDRRSGYYFITNALGTQADGRIADDGRILESSWDAAWQSAARRTEYGWSAEFSLPLSSVRYAAGKSQ